jgi:hypothetical protein
MHADVYTCKVKVWLYQGQAVWHFVSLPKTTAKKIKTLYAGMSGGFGSLPVVVTIGKTIWKTSIFPDTKLLHTYCP